MDQLSRAAPLAQAALRIVIGLIMVEHGLMKLIGFPGMTPGVPAELPPLLVVAAVLELVGGALLVLGLFTRIAAFVLSGEMAAAYFMGHASRGFWPGLNGGDLAVVLCFALLFLSTSGPGAASVDALRNRRGRAF